MQEEPSKIAVVQISRTEYIMKSYHDMVDHRNAFYGSEINEDHIVYIGDLKLEIRTRAVRHVISTRRNSRFNKS